VKHLLINPIYVIIAPPRTESPLYTVETGQDSASAFCLQRDGTIRYGNCSVDYANNELIYDLCFLEGLFPFHKIKGTAYFEGNGNKTHEIWINGHKKIALVVKSKQAYNFEILVPRELYQTGHRVTVSIKNPQANGVYLSGLKVYRSIDGKAGNGGPQSAGSGALESWCHLIVTPNPFSNNLKIRLQIPEQSNEKAGIKIYDTAGRLIKSFRQSTSTEHNKSELSWDGCDDNGRQLPGGIYFIELKSGNQSKTEKVIKLR
jgi:hypothetical protein